MCLLFTDVRTVYNDWRLATGHFVCKLVTWLASRPRASSGPLVDIIVIHCRTVYLLVQKVLQYVIVFMQNMQDNGFKYIMLAITLHCCQCSIYKTARHTRWKVSRDVIVRHIVTWQLLPSTISVLYFSSLFSFTINCWCCLKHYQFSWFV